MRDAGDIVICPLCGRSAARLVSDLTTAAGPDTVPGRIMRCRACSMWFKVLAPAAGIPTEYRGESGDDDLARTYLDSDAARALFRLALSNLVVRPAGSHPRLLDLGAAQGTLLEEAQRMGFEAEGIEHSPSNVGAAAARGLRVSLGAVEDLAAEERFDVITMVDLIEHLADPVHVLRAVHRALKPGGDLVVYTPNHRAAVVVLARLLHAVGVRYPVQEIFGRNHVCFFDDRSLPLALRRSGFEVRSMHRFPYDPARPGQEISRLNLAVVTVVEWLGRPLGRVFRMLVHARKITPPGTAEGNAPG